MSVPLPERLWSARPPAWLVVASACILAVWLPCQGISAQADREEARRLFTEASEQLRAGRFAEARDLLTRSSAIVRSPATAFNLAVAFRGTGDLLRAERVLSELLEGLDGPTSESQRERVETLLSEVRADIGLLIVDIEGSEEAEVRVDGVLTAREVRLNPGEHLLRISAPDRISVEERIRTEAGERRTLTIRLEPTPESLVGTLILEAPNESDRLQVDGEGDERGRLERQLTPGEHLVRVDDGSNVREATVVVRAGRETRYVFSPVANRSVAEEPAFWLVLGGVLVAAGAAVAIGFAVDPPVMRMPATGGPVFGVVVALEMP